MSNMGRKTTLAGIKGGGGSTTPNEVKQLIDVLKNFSTTEVYRLGNSIVNIGDSEYVDVPKVGRVTLELTSENVFKVFLSNYSYYLRSNNDVNFYVANSTGDTLTVPKGKVGIIYFKPREFITNFDSDKFIVTALETDSTWDITVQTYRTSESLFNSIKAIL